MEGARSAEAERLDALRRRLYAPDVTAADVAAYRAAVSEQEPSDRGGPDGPAAAPAAARAPLPRRVRAGIVAGGVLLVAAGIALVLTTRPLAALTAAGPSPSPTATSAAAGATAQERVPASSAVRAQFVRSLQQGDSPGLLEYLYGHAAYLPPQIRTPQRANSTEYSGQGASTIDLDPSDLAQRGGRMTVILVLDRPATFSWVAGRIAQRNDRSGPVVSLGAHAGAGRTGEPVSATLPYAEGAPARLDLYLDETVKWGAVVVFTN